MCAVVGLDNESRGRRETLLADEEAVVSKVSALGRKLPIVLVSEVAGSSEERGGECTLSASIADAEARDRECGRGPKPVADIHVDGVEMPEDIIPGVEWKNGGNGRPIPCGKKGGAQPST